MLLTSLDSTIYPVITGNRQLFVGTGNGPASYNQTTGDLLSVGLPGFQIDSVWGVAVTPDLKYIAVPVPVAIGEGEGWTLFWYNFVASAGATPAWTPIANNSTVLASEQIQLTVIGLG
jgi:hypothetical protein